MEGTKRGAGSMKYTMIVAAAAALLGFSCASNAHAASGTYEPFSGPLFPKRSLSDLAKVLDGVAPTERQPIEASVDHTEPPYVFVHYHVLPDGTVEVSGTYGVRLYEVMPDGHVEEHIGIAICLDQSKSGDRLSPGQCQKQLWAVTIFNYLAGFDGATAAGVVGGFVGSKLGAPWLGLGTGWAGGQWAGEHGGDPIQKWIDQGCPWHGQKIEYVFQYEVPKDFDFSFPGGFLPHGSMPIITPWLEGVGDGHCTGGDVLRVPTVDPSVAPDGRVGSTNPTDVWIGWTFGSPPFSGAAPLSPWEPGDPGSPVQPPPPPAAPPVGPSAPVGPGEDPGGPDTPGGGDEGGEGGGE